MIVSFTFRNLFILHSYLFSFIVIIYSYLFSFNIFYSVIPLFHSLFTHYFFIIHHSLMLFLFIHTFSHSTFIIHSYLPSSSTFIIHSFLIQNSPFTHTFFFYVCKQRTPFKSTALILHRNSCLHLVSHSSASDLFMTFFVAKNNRLERRSERRYKLASDE